MVWAPTNNEITFQNVYLGHWEMDVMVIKGTGYVYEYEVKVSHSDFKADFKKKHYGRFKHDKLKAGKEPCNRFFFVCPDGMIKESECPVYAGLIYYDQDLRKFKTVKNAPILHRNKFKDYKYLCQKLYYRLLPNN